MAVPFIATYRKEVTGQMTTEQLTELDRSGMFECDGYATNDLQCYRFMGINHQSIWVIMMTLLYQLCGWLWVHLNILW